MNKNGKFIAYDNDSGENTNFKFSQNLEAGEYYAVIHGNYHGNYSVSLDIQEKRVEREQVAEEEVREEGHSRRLSRVVPTTNTYRISTNYGEDNPYISLKRCLPGRIRSDLNLTREERNNAIINTLTSARCIKVLKDDSETFSNQTFSYYFNQMDSKGGIQWRNIEDPNDRDLWASGDLYSIDDKDYYEFTIPGNNHYNEIDANYGVFSVEVSEGSVIKLYDDNENLIESSSESANGRLISTYVESGKDYHVEVSRDLSDLTIESVEGNLSEREVTVTGEGDVKAYDSLSYRLIYQYVPKGGTKNKQYVVDYPYNYHSSLNPIPLINQDRTIYEKAFDSFNQYYFNVVNLGWNTRYTMKYYVDGVEADCTISDKYGNSYSQANCHEEFPISAMGNGEYYLTVTPKEDGILELNLDVRE